MGKSRLLFLAEFCLTPHVRIPSGGILCEKGKIIATGGATAFSRYEDGLEIIELPNTYAVPGFIDCHVHGIGDMDTAKAGTPDFSLREMSRRLAVHGVTTFFPTLVSLPKNDLLRCIDAISSEIIQGCPDAVPHGIHIEGPFINPAKRGSQSEDAISPVDEGYIKELIAAGHEQIHVMTFAPELKNSVRLVELLMENGIIPSMGHSLATEEEALRCVDAGVARCTYVFNGMPLLNHRESSLTTVALTDDRISVEVIVDGVHVAPRMIDLAYRCKPKSKLIGISNAVSTSGTDAVEGIRTGEEYVEIVKTRDGVLSGSTLTLENSWLQLMKYAKIPKETAAACFTHNPAVDLGLITRGELRPGLRADITFFDTRTNEVRMTVSRGDIIYRKD